jgi:hypothetical protein
MDISALITQRKNSYSSSDSSGDEDGDGDELESSRSGKSFYLLYFTAFAIVKMVTRLYFFSWQPFLKRFVLPQLTY